MRCEVTWWALPTRYRINTELVLDACLSAFDMIPEMTQSHPSPPVSGRRPRQQSILPARLRAKTVRVREGLARRSQRRVILARLPRAGVGAEIGTWKGDFTAKLLGRTRPRQLYLIDPWAYRQESTYKHAMYGDRTPGEQERLDGIYESVLNRFSAEIESGQVVVRRLRSTDAAADLEDDSLDWVYIDGDHTYEAVKSDLQTYLRVVKPGGVLAGDDYGQAGWWGNGVTRAVDEFAASGRCGDLTVIGSQFIFTKN
jgi:SAM-dependent methyltransferase